MCMHPGTRLLFKGFKMVDTTIEIAGLKLRNPVTTASGTFGYGPEYSDFVKPEALGAVIVKGTTLNPRQGNPYPRMAETPSGMLNAVGLQNGGVNHFIEHILPEIKNYDTNIIVNVAGSRIEEYVEVCRLLAPFKEIRAVEINISCPNVKEGGMAFGTDPRAAADVTEAVRKVWPRAMIVKLSPNVTDIVPIALAVQDAGADAVSLINTLTGMVIDTRTRRPVLSTVTGGLSGPAVRPVALRMVWQVARAVNIPVIGLGGIMTADDALQFIMAGASAVQIGTANFVNPQACLDVINGIQNYCSANHIDDIKQLIGCVNR